MMEALLGSVEAHGGLIRAVRWRATASKAPGAEMRVRQVNCAGTCQWLLAAGCRFRAALPKQRGSLLCDRISKVRSHHQEQAHQSVNGCWRWAQPGHTALHPS